MSSKSHFKIDESRQQKNIEKRRTVRRTQEGICGKNCFLLPDEYKFPICDLDCALNCNKVHAAYVRAKEWKYENISRKAATILKTQCQYIVS